MRKITMGLLALALVAAPAMAQMGGGMGGGGMGGGGMGGGPGGEGGGPGGGHHGGGEGGPGGPEKPREMKPITLKAFDRAVTGMFAAADANRDGFVTLAEFQSVIEGRRDAMIRARFKKVDTNHDGQINLDEFTAWQREQGAAALAEQGFGPNVDMVAEVIRPDLGESEKDFALLVAIDPLNPAVIGKADANYDGKLSLDELLAYEHERFNKADTDHDGVLSAHEIEAMRPRGAGPRPGGFGGPSGFGGPGGRPGGPGGRPGGEGN
jgi:Ca2+-binding EF-hand superfamily protein